MYGTEHTIFNLLSAHFSVFYSVKYTLTLMLVLANTNKPKQNEITIILLW